MYVHNRSYSRKMRVQVNANVLYIVKIIVTNNLSLATIMHINLTGLRILT